MANQMQSFEETHFLGNLLKGKVASGLHEKFEEIDLRFLNRISMGDTYNGDDDPCDGVSYNAVMYGNQIAYEYYAVYHNGSNEMRQKKGNVLYQAAYFASQLYLKIQEVARAMYFREDFPDGDAEFYMSQNDLALLSNHPQWQQMVEHFGLELEPRENGRALVKVSKFYVRKESAD